MITETEQNPLAETENFIVLDHYELDEWFENNPYTCFMSEYNAPHKCIFEIQKQKLANNKNVMKREYATEKLFWNGK